jgi:hypothetical protein
MRSVAICLVMLLAFVLIDSNANAQCFSSAANFFAGGNVAFLNAPAAVVSPVVVQQQRVAVRRGLFGRKQTVVVRQPRVQNIVVGQSRLLIK